MVISSRRSRLGRWLPDRSPTRSTTAGGAVDVHLMIEAPERHLAAFAEAGADSITFHVEATPHANRTLDAIRGLGCSPAWRSIRAPRSRPSPSCGLRRSRPLHDRQPRLGRPGVHRVLARQGLPPRPPDRRRQDRGRRWHRCHTAAPIAAAGASLFVAGSAIFASPDPEGLPGDSCRDQLSRRRFTAAGCRRGRTRGGWGRPIRRSRRSSPAVPPAPPGSRA